MKVSRSFPNVLVDKQTKQLNANKALTSHSFFFPFNLFHLTQIRLESYIATFSSQLNKLLQCY